MIPPQDGQKTGQSMVGDASRVRSRPAAALDQLGQDEVCNRILVRTGVNLGIKLSFKQLIFPGSYLIIRNLGTEWMHHSCPCSIYVIVYQSQPYS